MTKNLNHLHMLFASANWLMRSRAAAARVTRRENARKRPGHPEKTPNWGQGPPKPPKSHPDPDPCTHRTPTDQRFHRSPTAGECGPSNLHLPSWRSDRWRESCRP